ncbi:MAG: glycosyltransferase family 2 protein [Candidatus Kerfeldbacteria bacterium]|nr:glycosyltransferase family 2 protein [Candidatus Kerfeldbacteria bacterium]
MNPKPTVAIHIVTWNSITHIAACLDAVAKQLTPDMTVMIVDNASIDGTVAWIEEHYPHFHLLRNTRNVGYCRAHNQALRLSSSAYVLFLNPDVILADGWLSRAVSTMEQRPSTSAIGGKLRRFSYTPDELKEIVFSRIIDSTGLQVSRNRHTVDRGSGEEDTGQYDTAGETFGFSGACVMYRRTALESVRYRDEYLDDDLFAYKEDLDLSWRLQRLGWNAWYDPALIGWHHRTIKGTSKTGDLLIAKNYRSRDRFNIFYSYRNHWLVLTKNETWSTVWRDGFWIALYELKKLVFLTLTGRLSLQAVAAAWRLRSNMNMKAQVINHHAKRSPLEVRQWFLH